MKFPRPQFRTRQLMAFAAMMAFGFGYFREITVMRQTDDRFVAWVKRSIEPPGSPWLHIYESPLPPLIPFFQPGEGYIELVTPTKQTIVVRAQLWYGDRIGRVTATAAGREVEVPPGAPDANQPFDFRAALPEAFR